MKNKMLLSVIALAALVGQLAQAQDEVSSTLRTLKVTVTSQSGTVVKVRDYVSAQSRQVLVGIPVSIDLGDACTSYVGQQTTQLSGVAQVGLQALGATDPLVDACVAIAVSPINRTLTLSFDVPKTLPVAVLTQRVLIGQNVYTVTYDIHNNSAEILPAYR